MSILKTIVEKKALRVAHAKRQVSLGELTSRIRDMEKTRDFPGALKREGTIRLIAEVKKASPSKGLIRKDFDPSKIAAIYRDKPVSAISVLTEEDFFKGDLSYIKIVRHITSKPVLRKDFIFDPYQIYEARANSADAVLLIAAILERNQAKEYMHMASECGLHVLFEVHDETELEAALDIGAGVIGINNRDLKTMRIDLGTTLRLKREVPKGVTVVSESGIRSRKDVLSLEEGGIDAMLIGTSFMESPDIGAAIDELMSPS